MAYRKLSESEWLLHRYKYSTLSNDISDSNRIYSLENLANNVLFFQKPVEFNDPFDSTYCIVPCPVKDFEKGVRKAISDRYPEFPSAEVDKKVLEVCAARKPEEVLTQYKRLKDDLFKRLGILCLAPNNTDILMWSHYADGHSGICLEIDFANCYKYLAAQHPIILVGAVGYSDDFPSENLMSSYLSEDKNDALAEIQNVLFTKSTHWSYEREVRIICLDLGGKAVKFGDSIYKSVTIGADTNPQGISEIKTALRKRGDNLPLYRATPKQDRYELEIRRLDY
jgi:hypothetical protein